MSELYTQNEMMRRFHVSAEKVKKLRNSEYVKIYTVGKNRKIFEVFDEQKLINRLGHIYVGTCSGKNDKKTTMNTHLTEKEKEFFYMIIERFNYPTVSKFIKEAMYDKAADLGFDYKIWKEKNTKEVVCTRFTMVSPGIWKCQACEKNIFSKTTDATKSPNIEICPHCGADVV